MSAITLQFVHGTGFGANLIQWFDHGKFSHVDSVLADGTLLGARDDTVLGIPPGVQIRPSNYMGNEPVLRVAIPVPDTVEKLYYGFITSQLGKAYDEKAILAFVAGRNWMAGNSWFCSELCAAGLVASGFVHKLSAPANKIAPDDLLLVCSAFVEVAV